MRKSVVKAGSESGTRDGGTRDGGTRDGGTRAGSGETRAGGGGTRAGGTRDSGNLASPPSSQTYRRTVVLILVLVPGAQLTKHSSYSSSRFMSYPTTCPETWLYQPLE